MKKSLLLTGALALILGLLLGRSVFVPDRTHEMHAEESAAEAQIWTCSMHPQIQRPGPGACPICGMDLIPVHADGGSVGLLPSEISLSEHARTLAEVEVAPVERRFVEKTIRMVGTVEIDQTRLVDLTARVPGRLDRLFVDYAGIKVRKGDHMVTLYSPALLAAQEEFLQTLEAIDPAWTPSDANRTRAKANVESSRDKLLLLGLTEDQIADLEKERKPDDHVTFYSPIEGVVLEKTANEGSYVDTGTRIYRMADLSQVWVMLDAYESDLAWIQYGQQVSFEVQAYPGDPFTGTIAFIDPVLDPKTRTVKIRVNAENTEERLKPGMFVRASIQSRLAEGGRPFAPELAGKWICPMHPEFVRDEQTPCEICGMDLVRASTLGNFPADQTEAPLVIPATAPLITGERAVVYVRDPDRDQVYRARTVRLGQRAGDDYLVREGLKEGELVVRQGAFKIDSAIQIQAGPGMMNPKTPAAPMEYTQHAEPVASLSAKQVDALMPAYSALTDAVRSGNLNAIHQAAETWESSDLFQGMETDPKTLSKAWQSFDLEAARSALAELTQQLIPRLENGSEERSPVYVIHCPMAENGEGADWLQRTPELQNPYFSGGMLGCGTVISEIGVGK